MNKYNIEGNIDFYSELTKKLSEEDKTKEKEEYKNTCLITNTPLIENFITLECNHKFNYIPLYKDILNHKNNFNYMETRYLKIHELRCPYCRNIQKKLIPYYENIKNVKKVHGVNFIDENLLNSSKNNSNNCCTSQLIGVCAFENNTIKCKYTNVTFVNILNNTYCINHKHKAIQEYYNLKKQKEDEEKAVKEQKKEQAILEKKQKKEQAILEKEQAILEKEQAKLEKKAAKEQKKEQAIMEKKAAKEQKKEQSELEKKAAKEQKKEQVILEKKAAK
jgi:hypothetical protein